MKIVNRLYDHIWAIYHLCYYIVIYGFDGAEKQISEELKMLRARKEQEERMPFS